MNTLIDYTYRGSARTKRTFWFAIYRVKKQCSLQSKGIFQILTKAQFDLSHEIQHLTMIWWWFYKMKKIMCLLLKSRKFEIQKFKNIETCQFNAIFANFHNFGTNLKIFSSLQHNFMKNQYQVQNLKIWWIHENSYVKLNFFRNSTKSYTSKYYVVHWAVSPELCFCLDLKTTS